jgi:hypothetical protein
VVQVAGREMIVLEFYRCGSISSGKAAELLRRQRIDFIQHPSKLGFSHFARPRTSGEAEMASLESL